MPDVDVFVHDMRARTGPRDGVIASLAARQHGVVGRSQLAQLGFGSGAIHHRVAVGRLHRLHSAVYAVGHTRLTDRGRWMAAVLACGSGALLSHQSAGALWGLRPTSRTSIDVTAPGRTRALSSGISVHRVRHRHPDDWCVRDRIPVTSVARTLLDLAESVSPTQLRRAFEDADRLELIDMRAIEQLLDRSRGRRGLKPLAALLATHRGPAPPIRSELERLFLDLCHRADLPPPTVNAHVEGLEVDALWPEQRLIVELDGYAFHHDRAPSRAIEPATTQPSSSPATACCV
jgi:Transcriptional regulator, AbiEi antitoxin